MNEFEFNITVVGTGNDVDEAFENALWLLAQNPNEVIKGEVVYVNMTTSEAEAEEDKEEEELIN